MTWMQGIVAYVVIWWVVIFAVLPFGIRPTEEGDIGHAAGAPANPRLWFKAGVTTVVAAMLWLGLFLLVKSDWVSFRPS